VSTLLGASATGPAIATKAATCCGSSPAACGLGAGQCSGVECHFVVYRFLASVAIGGSSLLAPIRREICTGASTRHALGPVIYGDRRISRAALFTHLLGVWCCCHSPLLISMPQTHGVTLEHMNDPVRVEARAPQYVNPGSAASAARAIKDKENI
jgi:hypothetical protein